MKKLFASIAIAVAFAASAAAEENIVNIYNWSDYIADDTVAKFEADSGTKVRETCSIRMRCRGSRAG